MSSEIVVVHEPRHCQRCGASLSCLRNMEKYRCDNGHSTYLNPVPVVVAILPVEGGGYVQVRRSIEPGAGKLAFPGGNAGVLNPIEVEASREVAEEIGFAAKPELWRAHHIESATGLGKTLLFFQYDSAVPADFEWCVDRKEVTEVIVVTQMPSEDEMAFPIHAKVLRGLFETGA